MILIDSIPYFKFMPVDNAIAEHSVNLSGKFHKATAYRIIVATSRIYNIPLITSDEKILKCQNNLEVNLL